MRGMLGSTYKNVLIYAVLVFVYFVSAKLGLNLAFINASASAVWPPTGIAIASLLVLGLKFWPAIFLGAFLANFTTAGTVLTSLGIATGNTLEGVIGAYLIARFAGGRLVFGNPKNIFKFTVIAGVISPIFSATIGVLSLALGGLVLWKDFWPVWITWMLGDATGALIVAPFLIIWMTTPRPVWDFKRGSERISLLLILIFTSQLVFGGIPIAGVSDYPLDFLLFPVILWIAFRYGVRHTVTATFLVSVIAIRDTLRGTGPFARESPNESLLLLQSFMAVVTITKLMVASTVEKGRELDSLKDEFISMVSHELRTPLAAIKGFTSMIATDKYGKPPEKMKEPLKNIENSAERLISLVSGLLQVSRIESGSLKPEISTFNVNKLINEVIEELKPMAAQKNINLISSLIPEAQVKADMGYTRQILVNLIGNAIKFTHQGKVEVSLKSSGRYLNVYVADSGMGIAKKDQPLVFDKFFQVISSSKGRPSGTGLGLYLSAQMAKKMEGQIRLEKSEVGRGSTFVLLLPMVS